MKWEGNEMYKRSLAIVGVLLLAAMLPFLAVADTAGDEEIKIVDIMVYGLKGPEDEYSLGDHMVAFQVHNNKSSFYFEETTFHLMVYYGNGTMYYSAMMENYTVSMDGKTMVWINFTDVDFPEGSFDISVNGTIDGEETMATTSIYVMDVVDLSIESDFFIMDGIYPLGEELTPTATIMLEGNVEDWKDQVSIHIEIQHLDSDPILTVHEETMVIMDNESSPKDPGESFYVMFSTGWTPNRSGDFRARFMVDYDSYNESNNEYSVFFEVEQPHSIEGWVKTTNEVPVVGVNVRLSTPLILIGETTTDVNGYYFFDDVDPGTYDLEFTKMWSTSNSTTVNVEEGMVRVVNATVNKLPVGGLQGTVYLPGGMVPAEGAEVTVNIPGEVPLIDFTDSDGNFSFEIVKAETMDIVASLEGYDDGVLVNYTLYEQTWNTVTLELVDIDFTLTFSPPDGEPGFPVGQSISLVFSKRVNISTINDSNVYLTKLSTTENVPVQFSFIELENTVLVSGVNSLEYGTQYRITVTDAVEDIYGNNLETTYYSDFTTEIEIIEIELVTYYPADDQSEVPVDISIWAVFPEPMDPTYVTEDYFQVFISGGGGNPIPGTVYYYSGNYTAEFIPVNDLQYNGRYSVSLSGDVRPIDTTKVFRGFTWSFETMPLITTGTVSGYVLDEDGEPFTPSLVTITIQREGGAPINLFVNNDGKFEEGDLAEGTWTLKVTIEDYEDYETTFDITAKEETTIDTVSMEPVDDTTDNGEILGYIAVAVFILVILAILAWVFLGRRERPVVAEEEEERPARGRPAAFGAGRERPAYREPEYFDELPEGEFMCPVCGYVVEAAEPDCPNCGAEFEEDLFECPECAAMISGDAIECPECGSVFEEELPDEEEEDYYEEEEEIDLTEEYEVDEMEDDEDIPLPDQ